MIRDLDRQVREQTGSRGWFSAGVLMAGGFCPGGCGGLMGAPTGIVYRSSRRSVTMRCQDCGLLWTMTVHQLAKATRRKAERMGDDEVAVLQQGIAARLEQWSELVDEDRGRRRV
jgi:hypothetical protein